MFNNCDKQNLRFYLCFLCCFLNEEIWVELTPLPPLLGREGVKKLPSLFKWNIPTFSGRGAGGEFKQKQLTMIQISWAYLQNPFENVTKRNYKRMYLMATDHFDKLKQAAPTDAKIQELLDFGEKDFDAYVLQYRQGSTQGATYRMNTANFENIMADLSSTQIRRWDIEIQFIYDVVRPEYKALLPNGRKPFQSGAYDLRIDQVLSLADRLKAFPDLTDLQAKVQAFGEKAIAARTKQQGNETMEKNNSNSLEEKRQTLAKAMHGIFGGLIRLYYNNPAKVEEFYELQYLRSSSSNSGDDDAPRESVSLQLTAESSTPVLQGQLQPDDVVRITNTGGAVFTAFLTVDMGVVPDATLEVAPGQMITLTATKSGESVVLVNRETTVGSALVELV